MLDSHKIDYVMRALEKAVMREIPTASCPVKESKNQWMRDRLKKIIGDKLRAVCEVGPQEYKNELLGRL